MRLHLLWWLAIAWPAAAQPALSLPDAIRQALAKHPSVTAAGAQVRAAEARVSQARGGLLPQVNYSESFQRSDNPVFVFSSLLTQRQFRESNFAIGSLNRPDFLNNFQSVVSVDQNVWDFGATRRRVEIAELGRTLSAESERNARLLTTARVVETYFGAKMARASLEAAREAVRSAEADLERAQAVRGAGMSTDADVLSIRAHLAAVQQEEIRRAGDLDVALAGLNEVLGLALDTAHDLVTPFEPLERATSGVADVETRALAERPEVRQARLSAEIADKRISAARTALFPQIGVRGMFEADRQEFVRKGGANWLVAASLKWNLFDGGANRARIAEASAAHAATVADARRAESGVRLEVRRAWAVLHAADERIRVATAAIAHAEESLRIVKNRYDAGMATVTDLLRTETALVDARTRRLGAIYDQRVAAAALEAAAGTLTADSEALK